jgi:hypothetical protein
MAKKKIADLLVEVLAEAGVREIYGVSGDSLNGITDSIRTREQIQWVHMRHEEAAGSSSHGTAGCMRRELRSREPTFKLQNFIERSVILSTGNVLRPPLWSGRFGPCGSSQYSVSNREEFCQTDFSRSRTRVSGKVHQCIASERHRAVESCAEGLTGRPTNWTKNNRHRAIHSSFDQLSC